MFGVTFGTKHSYNDWKLITKSRPVIGSPSPKTNYIDVPEADGKLDFTEALTGEVKYDNREITFEFTVIEARNRWVSIYSEIMNFLHGRKMNLFFDEDPNHYYVGRFQIDEWNSDKRTSTLVIKGNVDPYKYELFSSTEDWIWDTFNFENDVVREYSDLVVDERLEFTVVGSRKSVVPIFTVLSENGDGMQVTFKGSTYNLQDGVNRVVNIIIKEGESQLIFTGSGTVSIEFRGGSL